VTARPTGVVILGSTGSIGVSTLDVLARHGDRFRVVALTAQRQVERMLQQCRAVRPRLAVMADADAAATLATAVRAEGLGVEVRAGAEAVRAAASCDDAAMVMAAVVGAAGLLPALDAVRAGKRVLIANKEPLVMSGHIFMREAQRSGAEILPIDSEHNAIFQCMPAGYRAGAAPAGVRRVLLTCSGGPFRERSAAQMRNVTPEEACAHPRWVMGRKISVDSATLMNKGLELIEACRLFAVEPSQVEIVIHPQSVVHSMVEYTDGSVLAQMGNPDMRTPIAHALAWPERMDSGVRMLDLFEVGRLDFERPDLERFPCLRLAYEAARAGGTAPAVLNAANEVAVQAFLDGRIRFPDIAAINGDTLAQVPADAQMELDAIMAADHAARTAAEALVQRRAAA